jgi:hypothetical protein
MPGVVDHRPIVCTIWSNANTLADLSVPLLKVRCSRTLMKTYANKHDPVDSKARIRGWPAHGWIGLALVATFWTLNWSLPGLRTHWGFFPLWLGYCLIVDALVFRRKGSSLLTRSARGYVTLFLVSAPAWWLFEIINWRTQNWLYEGRQSFTNAEYFVLATLSFSTVMPAVFETAELVGTFNWLKRLKPGPSIVPTRATSLGFFIAGWLMLALLLLWPRYFFPFVWIAIYFILEPTNVWLGNRSLLHATASGDWRPVVALWTGCLLCGFFWEMWNFRSFPKWTYHVPFVDFWHVFEMPLLGYLGYLPFSLELFALYQLVMGTLKHKEAAHFIQVLPDERSVFLPRE